MPYRLSEQDKLGLIRPAWDAHSLGISALSQLLAECGISVCLADCGLMAVLEHIEREESGRALRAWILGNGISALGFSYRLDPEDGLGAFTRLYAFLRSASLLAEDGGPLRSLYFAGLPPTCALVRAAFPRLDGFFQGDESPAECLDILGLPRSRLPLDLAQGVAYDEARLAFGRDLVKSGDYRSIGSLDRSAAPHFGQRGDTLAGRVGQGKLAGLPPLMRAHVGPYLADRKEAVELFLSWTRQLATAGLLDVLSIGSSQLSQSRFGQDWSGLPDGGGVPINSPQEYREIWKAARPMLVRSYSGTSSIESLARMYQENIDIAWHALSLWWFCALDGRGPNGVLDNLREHFSAMRFIAGSAKPLEPNVPHHFAFRGSDDLSYVVSGFIAAKAAKLQGVSQLVLQTMLNTPKATWGVQDLAKARALLALVRELEGPRFRVFLQARGGLDYFSPDEEKAKAQLAAVTALMDDIEPESASSPDIIHVVSYSEALRLADPPIVNESVQITRAALESYRALKRSGHIAAPEAEARERTEALIRDARKMIACMEAFIHNTYSPEGLHAMLKAGFFPLPALAYLRDEYPHALRWNTRMHKGGVVAVDADLMPVGIEERLDAARSALA